MYFLKKTLIRTSFIALAALAMVPYANAASLGGSFTADNGAFIYLSTSTSSQGTLIGQGNQWESTFYLTNTTLVPGTTYYLHVEASNSGGAAGFIGQFNITGSGFQFSNGTQTLLTNTADWLGGYNDAYGGTYNSSTNTDTLTAQSWVPVNGPVASAGYNGTQPWGGSTGVNVYNVSPNAQWIWAADSQSLAPGGNPGNSSFTNGPCQNCTVDLTSGPITVSATPVPAPSGSALTGFLLAALGAFVFLRRRNTTAQSA